MSGRAEEVLQPRNTWEDKEAYDRQAADLARRFNENFKKYEAGVSEAVRAVAPKVPAALKDIQDLSLNEILFHLPNPAASSERATTQERARASERLIVLPRRRY